MSSFHTICAAIFLAAAAAATPAIAMPVANPDFAAVTVSTADLDLSSAGGVAALKQRIRQAAKTVCEAANAPAAFSPDAVRACRIDSMQRARSDVMAAIRVATSHPAKSVQLSANAR